MGYFTDIGFHQSLVGRRSVPGSGYYPRLKNIRSASLFMVDEPGLRPSLFWNVGVVALILILSGVCEVEGVNFTFNGFKGISDVYIVPNSGTWTYYPNDSSIFLDPSNICTLCISVAGRILYPHLVQMKDPGTMTVKSFSTNFIYQIYIQDGNGGSTGSGMAFMMVPDNITLGAPKDNLGLLTVSTPETAKNDQSDNHTFGVELDTHENPEFADRNGNHIGIDLASMNSTDSFVPTFTLATGNPDLYQQVWIDYFQADSHMDIYITQYGQDKPTIPFSSRSGLDFSILNEYMYIGFSAAVGLESSNLHKILAWSFSTDGPAPPIWIATGAPPAPSPVPPPRRAPPPPSPIAPPPSPIAAPNPAPNTSPPPASPPPPPVIIPPPASPLSPPPPAPSSPPYAPPPIYIPLPSPSAITPSSPSKPRPISLTLIISFGTIFGGVILLICCWKIYRVFTHPILFFLAHSSGENGATKNFVESLSNDMKSTWRYKFHLIRVFFDKDSLSIGGDFPEEINQALKETRVGVVIVTEDFFIRKWPMTELLSFVDSNKKGKNKVRILPLFYRLKVSDVNHMRRQNTWERDWENMSTEDHPIDVEKCNEAIRTMCKMHGIEYDYNSLGHDRDYIKRILKEVGKLCNKMVLWS